MGLIRDRLENMGQNKAAKVYSIGRQVREFNRFWSVINLCQVFNEFSNLLKDISASTTVTGIVQNTRKSMRTFPNIVL